MQSLYAQYIHERLGKEIVESDKGFATYFYTQDGACYIEDLYVMPEHRKSGVAAQMADEIAEIAKKNGINKLYGSVKVSAQGATTSLKVLLAYGFQLKATLQDAIILEKAI